MLVFTQKGKWKLAVVMEDCDPTLRSLRQEGLGLKARLGYIARPYLTQQATREAGRGEKKPRV